MRRFLRFLIGPLVRGLATSGSVEMRVCRTKTGSMVVFHDPFGTAYVVPFDVAQANAMGDRLYSAAIGHLENDPSLVDDDYETY